MQSRQHGFSGVDRGRGSKRVDATRVEVYDIDIAAWLHLNKVPIVEAQKAGRETVVTFYDPQDQNRIPDLMVTWLNSEAARFASAVRQIKKVSYSTERR
jgi:hypothetical protein